jgi:hypothetical protein
MNIARETIASTFFLLMQQLLQENGGPFVTVSRVFQLPQNISWDEDPSLWVIEWDEHIDERQSKGEEYYSFPLNCVVLGQMPDPTSGQSPGAVLNPLIDAVDNQIARTSIVNGQFLSVTPGEAQTLGGIVNNCFIDGRIQKADGYMAGVAHVIAKIPVNIVTGI